uniref:Retrovirus-related Pol polyprotein from transposon TNT 1-94 n=1 Tax=Tanacetum cinerariifolium TaxID=118510 RepID=A0A6L2JUW5_TANCI|nr:retrovirus-related Pol polyprotein from transposon TNT 1-94 [Tanacetum cinerariifolium]
MSKDKEIDKVMALISLSFKKIYKPTNNNLRTSSNTSRVNQVNSPRINRGTGYDNQRTVNVARARENVEQADWKDDTDDESDDQELEAHYMYMAKLQEVSQDAADNSGPIFDPEPMQQDDADDHANEPDLLASLIEKLKYEINVSKNRNKFLETSNKALVDKLKEIKKELCAHQETISILTQQKEAQIKLNKSREDKEYNKVIALENKVKVLDNIVYKTSQSVQTMNMLNRNCKTSFVKPEFLKKAQRANPRMYDIGCYIYNLALMLAPESDEVIRLEKESRSKLSDLIRPFDYEKLNNPNDLFVPQRKKSSTQRYFSERNGVNSRTKMPMDVPLSTIETKHIVNQSFAKLDRRTNALEPTNQKPRNTTRLLYESVIKACSWWYPMFTPPGYKWKPRSQIGSANSNLVEIILFIVDSWCSKHMTRNLKLLTNFVEKFLGTVKFGNDQIAPILGYRDLVQGKVIIKRVYYVKGLNHILFSVGQFCYADLEVVFRKSTCYIRDLKGNDLLTVSHRTDLYSITLQDTSSPNPICLMAKATSSQAWLWHRRLSHLNFNTINLLSKNDIVISLPKLKFVVLLVKSINGKKYVLVIVNDYSRYTWTHFLRSKDETPKVLIDFLILVQRGLHDQVRTIRTDKGTEFLNKYFHAFFAAEGIKHQTFVARTPEQNGIVERRNRTLVEAARIMLSAAKVPLFFWAESKAYRVFNKRKRVIVETIHVNFVELPHMVSDHVSSHPVPQCQNMALEHVSLSLGTQCQESVPQAGGTITTSNELDLLFSLMFDELLNGSTQVVSKSSAVTAVDAPHRRQQHHTTPLNTHTTLEPSFKDDEFINIFCTPVQDRGETSSRHVDSSNMHTFYQRHPSKHRWTKAYPLEQVIRNPSQSVRTRRQLESDGEMSKGYAQKEGVDFEESFVPVARLEAVRKKCTNQPDGFVDPYHLDKVYRLKKALYGLKQAPRAWYTELSNFMVAKGFSKGIQIHQSPRDIFMNQAKYAQEILIKHGMTSCDSIGTPMATKHLDANLSGTPVEQIKYRSMVRALMYLTASRPDIVHATCYCACYQAKPTEKHLTAVKWIFWYLKDTINMGLWYLKDTGFKLTAFLDSNHAGCLDSRKSTSGGIQFLGGDKLVSWSSKKQDCTSMSLAEAEYVSLSACSISYNPVQHSRTKHIDVRYNFIKEKVEKGIIELFFVGTEYQLADLFTKALSEDRFKYLVRRLGMRCLTPEELEVLANEYA